MQPRDVISVFGHPEENYPPNLRNLGFIPSNFRPRSFTQETVFYMLQNLPSTREFDESRMYFVLIGMSVGKLETLSKSVDVHNGYYSSVCIFSAH